VKPTKFPEANCVYGAGQEEYLPLPAYKTPEGEVTTCWELTWRERLRVLWSGKMWWTVLTFNHPLQPQRPEVGNPFWLG
jgi:hypothetical protein